MDTDGSLLIITKPVHKQGPVAAHRVYRAPPGGGELQLVGEFSPPDPPLALQSLVTGNVVTDAATLPGRVLLLTYDQIIEYTAPDPAAPLATFFSWPQHTLPKPEQIQSEGIAPTVDGCGYAVVSEGGPGGAPVRSPWFPVNEPGVGRPRAGPISVIALHVRASMNAPRAEARGLITARPGLLRRATATGRTRH